MLFANAFYPDGKRVSKIVDADESGKLLTAKMQLKPWLDVKEAWEQVREDLYWAFSEEQTDECLYVDIADIMFAA